MATTLSVENVEKHTNNLGHKRLNAPADADNLSNRSSKQTQGIGNKGITEVLKKKDGENKPDRKKSLAGLLGKYKKLTSTVVVRLVYFYLW